MLIKVHFQGNLKDKKNGNAFKNIDGPHFLNDFAKMILEYIFETTLHILKPFEVLEQMVQTNEFIRHSLQSTHLRTY